MMSTLTDTLTRLAREFAVRDIMIPERDSFVPAMRAKRPNYSISIPIST